MAFTESGNIQRKARELLDSGDIEQAVLYLQRAASTSGLLPHDRAVVLNLLREYEARAAGSLLEMPGLLSDKSIKLIVRPYENTVSFLRPVPADPRVRATVEALLREHVLESMSINPRPGRAQFHWAEDGSSVEVQPL